MFMMVSQYYKVALFLQISATGEKEEGCLCVLDFHAQL